MTKEKEEKVKEEKPQEERPKEDKVRLLADASREKKKPRRFLLFLIPMLLIATAAGAYFFYGDEIMQGVVTRHLTKKGVTVVPDKETAAGPILALEPFIFNLAGNSSRFAKVTLALGVRDSKVFEDSKRMVPVLRDKALSVLSAKSAEMLIDVNNRESIKKELHENLKGLFKDKNELQSVYITDIIIP
jgi:flagellar basal body-associated protein FliL